MINCPSCGATLDRKTPEGMAHFLHCPQPIITQHSITAEARNPSPGVELPPLREHAVRVLLGLEPEEIGVVPPELVSHEVEPTPADVVAPLPVPEPLPVLAPDENAV